MHFQLSKICKTTIMVLQLAWRGEWSLCGGLGNFRLSRLGWRGLWFRCGSPYRRLGGASYWLCCTAGYNSGHCGGVHLGFRCGAGWHWWLTRGVGSWNWRLHGSCRSWHSWWSTKTEEGEWESEIGPLRIAAVSFEILYYSIFCSSIMYIPGTHVLISLASIMLSGQTQVYLGGCLPTWGAARHKNSQPDTWHQSLPVMEKTIKNEI